MYHVAIHHQNHMAFSVQSQNHSLSIDAQGDTGISPLDALLAALGSCIGVFVRNYAKNTSINLENFTIHTRAELSADRPIRFKDINVTIEFADKTIDEKRRASILRFIKNCPVHNTLAMQPSITISIA